MMRRLLYLWCATLGCVLSLIACGGGGSENGGQAEAPTITTQPSNASLIAGENATFTVVASGSGLVYQWQRNGVDIPGATGANYTTTVAASDNGAIFTVLVSNAGGSVASAGATLAVTVLSGVTLQTGAYVASTLSSSSIGPSGGTLQVTDAADPLFGAALVFPASALMQPVDVALSSAPVSSAAGLPAGASVRSRAIRLDIKTTGTSLPVTELRRLVTLTLPTDATTDHVAYYKLDRDGALEPMGLDNADAGTRTITFRTRAPSLQEGAIVTPQGSRMRPSAVRPQAVGAALTYATYIAVGVAQTTLAQLMSSGTSIDSGFRPSRNGWFIPNYGSYFRSSRNGNCLGMVGFAKYYYQQTFATGLVDSYRDAMPTLTWVDDAVAIELASRVHNGMSDIWNTYVSEELQLQSSAGAVARSMIGALYVTGRPVLIYLAQVVGTQSSGAHAISTYKVDLAANGSAVFHVYDPNFPRDDGRSLGWSASGGFGNYQSGTTAADSAFIYNYFRHIGFYIGMTPDQLATLKTQADQGFTASVFPKVAITSIRGQALSDDVLGNTTTTPQGQMAYRTADRAVVIEGTVLGGNAQVAGQVVNNLHVVTPSGNFDATIDNQAGAGTGKFSVVVPLKTGINQVALLAADPNSVSNWAAFKEVLLESSAAPGYLTVTLNWNQGTSDIDLYLKEPDGQAGTPTAGKTGDIVYYAHRAGVSSTRAYLDFDNTIGYGPEHYIVEPRLTTGYSDGTAAPSPYGTYTVGVHYYAWHGASDATNRSVGWTVNWRLLSACNNGCADPETDGLWVTGAQAGVVADGNSAADGPGGFNGGDPSWSSKRAIPMPAPQTSWVVPPSNAIMLP